MRRLLGLVLIVFFMHGCSIRHVVAKDYPQYLQNNKGNYIFPQVGYKAQYLITKKTVDHNYEFRSGLTGYANVWVVNFGQILKSTLQSSDFQRSFVQLSAVTDNNIENILIAYKLINYRYENLEAKVTLEISVYSKDHTRLFQKIYYEAGKSQGGKIFWAGAFGMKNAIQQSTKDALDKILTQFLEDLRLITLPA